MVVTCSKCGTEKTKKSSMRGYTYHCPKCEKNKVVTTSSFSRPRRIKSNVTCVTNVHNYVISPSSVNSSVIAVTKEMLKHADKTGSKLKFDAEYVGGKFK